jgi:hypothetical protein
VGGIGFVKQRNLLRATLVAIALGVTCAAAFAATVRHPSKAPAGRGRAATAGSAASDSAALLAIVRDLSDPRLEGRGVGTAGIDSAASHLARRMSAIGLVPAGEEGGWFQWIEVTTGVAVGEPCAIEIGSRRWEAGEHFQPIGFSTNGTLGAPVVFAGYGITAPGYDYDDYQGLDVRDKIVLALSQEPGEMDSSSRSTAPSTRRTPSSAPRRSSPASTAPWRSWWSTVPDITPASRCARRAPKGAGT